MKNLIFLFAFWTYGLACSAQYKTLRYAVETWNGLHPAVSHVQGRIIIDEEKQNIFIQSKYREENYRIIRKAIDEEEVTVYSCEIRFPHVGIIRYVIKYDTAQSLFVLYPYNEYLKASTTFRITP